MPIARPSLARALPALCLLASGGAPAIEDAKFVVAPVRQFGHVIGDEITLDGSATVAPGYTPDADSLPKPGRVGAFLELRSARLDPASGDRYHLHVRFLVINSAPEVRTFETPPLSVRFRKAGAAEAPVTLPAIPLTISPLTPNAVLARDGLEELQPDLPPPHVATGWIRLRLASLAALALLLAGWFAWTQGWVPRKLLARRPFARARAGMRRLRDPSPLESRAEHTRQLHRAFDESAGFVVTAETLERFFAARPAFGALRDEIETFFRASTAFFYAGKGDAMLAPEALRELARSLAECELALARDPR